MKLRRQKALDPLTPCEQEKIATDLFSGQTFAEVRERIAKPRDQGGYDLRVSIKTLFTLHSRYAEYRRFMEGSPQVVTFADYIDLRCGLPQPHTLLAQRHIQKVAYDIVTTENSHLKPAELLALSRVLALPAQQAALDHKIEMDLHRKQMAEQRLALARRSLALREKQLAAKSTSDDSNDDESESEWDDEPEPQQPIRQFTAEEVEATDPELAEFIRRDPIFGTASQAHLEPEPTSESSMPSCGRGLSDGRAETAGKPPTSDDE